MTHYLFFWNLAVHFLEPGIGVENALEKLELQVEVGNWKLAFQDVIFAAWARKEPFWSKSYLTLERTEYISWLKFIQSLNKNDSFHFINKYKNISA